MPGYAYPVGADQATSGNPVSSSGDITSATTPVVIFTATSKTKITSVLVYNSYGTILPVNVFKKVGSTNNPLTQVRVLKSRYALQALVSGDSRVESTVLDRDTITEVVLESGDSISASCPIEDVITVTVSGMGGL
jgi:hypothetical protein